MTSSRLFKLLLFLAGVAGAVAAWSRYTEGAWTDPIFLRTAIAIGFVAMIVGLIGADTRPRLMLRFLAALFALVAVIAYAADWSQPTAPQAEAPSSLLQYLQHFAPVLAAATQKTVERWLGSFAWDPVLTTLLSLPAYFIFLLLALAAGLASRPRHSVKIFVNDR